jgi:hypothetical protein
MYYNEMLGTSVVAFLPRLTAGGSISLNTSIYRNQNNSIFPLADFGSNIKDYSYPHHEPYSVIATYDQGSTKFNPPPFLVNAIPVWYITNVVLLPLSLYVLAFLSFGIAFRHKRRCKSKLASNVLKDMMKVRDELVNNDKAGPSGIILRLHTWGSDTYNERQIVSDYRDYQKIDDFYSTVESRNSYLLQKQVSSDELNERNQACVNKAKIINTEINWRKFHKLDLILLIPALVLGGV